MKSRSIIFIAILSGIINSCHHQESSLSESQKSKIEKEITAEFMGLVSSHSFFDDTWLRYWSKSKFIGINAWHTQYTLQGLADSARTLFWPPLLTKRMEVHKFKIHLFSANSAMIENVATIYHVLKTKEERRIDIVETTIWEKEPDGWKVIYWHYSS